MVTSAINFDTAENYFELVPFSDFTTCPPVLQDFSLEQIKSLDFGEDFMKIPCHSQHVERYVYLTREVQIF